MKNFIFAISLILGSFPVLAEVQELVGLNCKGANLIQVDFNVETAQVSISSGAWVENFESNRKLFVIEQGEVKGTRIAIGDLGDPNVYIYDIYLERPPVKGEVAILNGYIGVAVQTRIYFTPVTGQTPLPVGFVPVTSVVCEVETK